MSGAPGDTDRPDTFDPRPVLRRLPHKPGVYRFLDQAGKVLYVGKARDLRKRVTSYFRSGIPAGKTGLLVQKIQAIEVSVSGSEGEALILENNLIKEHRPRFNVLLRDDKSYPYIHLSSDHAYPRLSFYRGSRRIPGRLFGPYPSAGAVRESLNLLQKLFRLRSCEDSFFSHRSRPCLQYQIQRCSGPCVDLIPRQEYAGDVEHAVRFLEGRSGEVISELVTRMEQASARLAFEEAGRIRDQITRLKTVQQQFAGAHRDRGDIDVLAVGEEGGIFCVAVMFVRGGRNLGSRSWLPKTVAGTDAEEVLGAFITQYYDGRPIPNEIVTDREVVDADLIEDAFSQRMERQVKLRHRVRGERARWLELAADNARHGLALHVASQAGMQAQLEALQEALGLAEQPGRIECFDISHTQGESTVASCVVFGAEGPIKSDYRRFNIADVAAGDDYAAMAQALARRYTRIKRGEAVLPDLLMVDGGKGQLSEATRVLDELQIEGLELLAVAKGRSRRPGHEQLFLAGRKRALILPRNSPALRLIQQIRDEAHRFAIAGHRHQRAKTRQRSILEDIPGLGQKRRSALLKEFGGLHGVTAASLEDLSRVRGISRMLAQRIYETLHPAE
ncbi:MAG: excinuclease ABC subunit UvrC [Gammaproteobacteria bacterium]